MSENAKVRIVVDGREIDATAGEPLIAAARRAGSDIPGLCWHPRLSPTGACRLCVVKIEGTRGLVASCATPVRAGMRVTAFDEELEETRRYNLGLLLSESRAGSDGSHRDELEELALHYGLDLAAGPSGAPGWVDESSPVLAYDPSRCIRCFRCIKGCEEIQGKGVISMHGRGAKARIATGTASPASWRGSECDGCGECVQLCPTGALVERPSRAEYRETADKRKVLTVCPYCGVGCRLSLTVGDGRILRAEGAPGLPNEGRLCVKGRFGLGFVASPERLTRPLVRDGEGFRETSWDEALTRAAEGLLAARQAGGPSAVAGYSSAKCTNEENYLFQKLFRVSLGTNNIDYCTRLCHASTVTAMIASLGDGAGSNSIEDYAKTGCVLVIGNNMAETHPVTATWLKQGRVSGSRLVVIDPKRTALAARADLALRPRLGSDVALLNGMTRMAITEGWIDRHFIETRVKGGLAALAELEASLAAYTPEDIEARTGVPPADLREATRLYATAPTAIIATGMGLSQQTVGTDNVHALINLMLVTGQIGRELCGIDPPRGQNNVQGATDVGCSPIYYPGYARASDEANLARLAALWDLPPSSLPREKGLTTVEIVKAAAAGKIHAMFIMGENPLHTDPNLSHAEEAFRSLYFLVVSDIFMTPTARLADVVLPAAAFAEKDGTFVNSDRRVQRVRKAVEPPGEAREDLRILLDLAALMGQPIGLYADASAVWDEVAKAAPGIFGGIDYARLEEEGIQWPCPQKGHPGTRTLFLERFNTEDGLARIVPVDWKPQAELPDTEYPFVLNTGRLLYHYHSSTMSRRSPPLVEYCDEAVLLVHPSDAATLGLSSGTRVRLSSRRGSIEAVLSMDEGVNEGELFLPFHFDESMVNRLTRDELDPSSKIAPFKNTAVRLERA